MSSSKIAVTGATGQQGGAVIRALQAHDADIVAVVRDATADPAVALADAGVELRQADLTDRGAVTEALRGTDAVFVMATMTGPDGLDGEIRVGTTVADAVRDSDAGYAVYSSVGGAERHTGIPHFDSKRRIEQHIESLGLRAGFVRPVFFMDNFATFSKPAVEDGTIVVRLPLPAARPLQVVAVADIGAVAAAMLLDPEAAPSAIEIGGDELTGEQIAEAYRHRYGLPARYEALPVDALGDDDQEAMFTWFATAPAYTADVAGTKALDPGVRTFAQWLDEFGPDDLG